MRVGLAADRRVMVDGWWHEYVGYGRLEGDVPLIHLCVFHDFTLFLVLSLAWFCRSSGVLAKRRQYLVLSVDKQLNSTLFAPIEDMRPRLYNCNTKLQDATTRLSSL